MNIFMEMLNLQKQLNETSFGKYKTNPAMWRRALLAELGEAIESTNYKWWKKQDPDMFNLKLELIDILHFALSYVLSEDHSEMPASNTFYAAFNVDVDKDIKDILVDIAANIYSSVGIIEHLGKAFKSLGMSPEDVYRDYLSKVTLNKFRQDKGYKQGVYKKIWNDEEDNVVAFRLADNVKRDDNFVENLYKELDNYYKEVK